MTFAIALWGAILSSILAYRHLTADWPRITLAQDEIGSDKTLLVFKNEGKHSLIIHKVRVLVGHAEVVPHSRSTGSAVRTAMNKVMHGDLQIIIDPNEEYKFSLSAKSTSKLLLFSVHWNSARLRLLPRIPLLASIRGSQLDALRRAAD
jgi:hypothetical protein